MLAISIEDMADTTTHGKATFDAWEHRSLLVAHEVHGQNRQGIRLGAFAFRQLEKLVHPRSDELVRIQLDASAPDIHIEKYGKIWIDMVRFCGIILDRKLK